MADIILEALDASGLKNEYSVVHIIPIAPQTDPVYGDYIGAEIAGGWVRIREN